MMNVLAAVHGPRYCAALDAGQVWKVVCNKVSVCLSVCLIKQPAAEAYTTEGPNAQQIRLQLRTGEVSKSI
jgi:hypothetical protein